MLSAKTIRSMCTGWRARVHETFLERNYDKMQSMLKGTIINRNTNVKKSNKNYIEFFKCYYTLSDRS